MAAIRTLIVDDEPLARQGLRVRLDREPDVEIVGEATDGPAAVEAIVTLRPHLVFLDVQMPGYDGFEVLARIADRHLPRVVFVTAYDRYALRAFVVHALDYLLKPIAHRRLQEALRRARAEVVKAPEPESADRFRTMLDARLPSPTSSAAEPNRGVGAYAARITVRAGERYVLLRTADIDWIEASANYVRLHAGDREFQIRTTMADLERRLDPAQFTRIHRSAMVNVDRIVSLAPDFHGDFLVVLKTGLTLKLSRGYRDRLMW
jgi:two-component system LytT family response regulator